MPIEQKDVFICHASEDKKDVVIPLTKELEKANITYWLDRAEIIWGDSLTGKVNEGLSSSRYVIVVLSENFLSKNWSKKELNSALNIEASSGEVLVLPLIVGNPDEKEEIMKSFPLMNDKLYLQWDSSDISNIINALKARLSKGIEKENKKISKQQEVNNGRTIPIPKIKKEFSEMDKDFFLKEAFNSIRMYFREALHILEKSNPVIKTDITDIHNFKFTCKIYVNGKAKCNGKIWVGGITSSNSIAYSEGQQGLDNDSSMNDWITIETDDFELGFKPSGFSRYTSNSNDKLLNIEQASEYLWTRFTEALNY